MDAPCSEEQPCESRRSPKADDVRALGRMQLSACHLVAPPMRQRLAARGRDALVLVPLAVLTLLLALFLKYVGDNFASYSSVPFLDFGDLRAVAGWFCVVGLFVPVLPVAVLVNEVISARKKGQTLGKAKAQFCVLGLRDIRVLRGSTIALPTVSRLMVANSGTSFHPNVGWHEAYERLLGQCSRPRIGAIAGMSLPVEGALAEAVGVEHLGSPRARPVNSFR